jgi:hypothetical protein
MKARICWWQQSRISTVIRQTDKYWNRRIIMAFVFDPTPKSTTGNSYTTISFADDYFFAHAEYATWGALSDTDKQRYLVMATNRLDAELYNGLKSTMEQKLHWPRRTVFSRDQGPNGWLLDPDTYPIYLQQAACEQALVYLQTKSGEFLVDENDLETLTSYKIGPLQVGIKNGLKADRIRAKVANLLTALGPDAWIQNKGRNLSL